LPSEHVITFWRSNSSFNPTGWSLIFIQVAVQDALGKKRQSVTDALGRLKQVIEDPGTGHLNYQITYIYDALNNLSTVTQGAQHLSIICLMLSGTPTPAFSISIASYQLPSYSLINLSTRTIFRVMPKDALNIDEHAGR
jgi:hypothetical protein